MDKMHGSTSRKMIVLVSQDRTGIVNWDDIKLVRGIKSKTNGKVKYDVFVFFRSGEKTPMASYTTLEQTVNAIDELRAAADREEVSFEFPEEDDTANK